MGNKNTCPSSLSRVLPTRPNDERRVSEINPEEIEKSKRNKLNVLNETDKVCIGEVEENIIKEPEHVLKNCELRIYLDEITLILQAGKCKNEIECFIFGTKFNMNFIKRSWRKIFYDVKEKICAAVSAAKKSISQFLSFGGPTSGLSS